MSVGCPNSCNTVNLNVLLVWTDGNSEENACTVNIKSVLCMSVQYMYSLYYVCIVCTMYVCTIYIVLYMYRNIHKSIHVHPKGLFRIKVFPQP